MMHIEISIDDDTQTHEDDIKRKDHLERGQGVQGSQYMESP